DAAGGRSPDAAVEGPGRAVDAEGERVDERLPPAVAQAKGIAVAERSDREKKSEVDRRSDRDRPQTEHGPPHPGPDFTLARMYRIRLKCDASPKTQRPVRRVDGGVFLLL